jgi:hypothetical protein
MFAKKIVTMIHSAKSIRPFIGAKNFEISRRFYLDLNFEEVLLSEGFSYFYTDKIGFYLQDVYVKDWIDNTMVFVEVDSVDRYYDEMLQLNLTGKYEGVRIVPTRELDWGKECFLHDPSGILWHFGEFYIK